MADIQKICNALEKAKDIIEQWIPMFEQHNTPSAIDDAIELLQKQIPKRALRSLKPGSWQGVCPECNAIIRVFVYGEKTKHCSNCGQAVKWG